MLAHLTVSGFVHAVLAVLCIGIGAVQLLRPKLGAGHRARGYAYVYAMLVADGAALLVYRFTGALNIFHIGALANIACIVLAIVPVLQTPRPASWRRRHYHFIAWSYVGLLAAALTEVIVRASYVTTRGPGWATSAAVTVIVTAIGYVMIERCQPASVLGEGGRP